MFFYIIIIFSLLIIFGDFAYPFKMTKPVQVLLGGTTILLLSALRFDVGYDYFHYYEIILDNGGDNYTNEPISLLILNLGKKLNYPPISFIVYSFLTVSLVIYVLYKNTKLLGIALFTYICFFYLDSFSGIRQSLALAVSMVGYKYVINRNLIKYFLITIIAFLIHNSAIICLLVYFLYNYVSIKKLVILIAVFYIFVFSILEIFIQNSLFGSSLVNMAQSTDVPGGNLVKYFFLLFILSLFIIAKLKKYKLDYKLFNILIFSVSIPFILGSHYGMRVSQYFLIYLCFLMPQFCENLKFKYRNVFMFFFACYFIMFIKVGWDKKRPTIGPYKTIFEIENIHEPHFKLP